MLLSLFCSKARSTPGYVSGTWSASHFAQIWIMLNLRFWTFLDYF
jgi:hypothetical protein